jgi:uncharacterized membrane protein YjgN (DUF898 family)
MAQDPGRGTLILVLGILSIVCCNLLGPLAWIWGKQDIAKIQAGEISPEAEQMTKIGMILGIIGTVLLVLGVVIGCIYGIIVAITAASLGKKAALDVAFDTIASMM